MNVLAVAVHPDDETLGCGATLLRLAAEGHELHWLVMTAAAAPDFSKDQAEQQDRQLRRVEEAYGFKACHWLKSPSTRLDRLPLADLVPQVRRVVEAVRPELVFVPNRDDAHSDHRVSFDAVMAVLKTFHMRAYGVRRILACEVPSETDAAAAGFVKPFVANVFVDVTATFERKLEIMRLYESEVHQEPLPRALSTIRALGRYRGGSIGVEYAEAFTLVREIEW